MPCYHAEDYGGQACNNIKHRMPSLEQVELALDEVNGQAENIQHHYSECRARGGANNSSLRNRLIDSVPFASTALPICGLLLVTLYIDNPQLILITLHRTTREKMSNPNFHLVEPSVPVRREGSPVQATGVKKGENNYRTAALTWKIARISPFQSHYKWDLIYGKTYLQKVLARL